MSQRYCVTTKITQFYKVLLCDLGNSMFYANLLCDFGNFKQTFCDLGNFNKGHCYTLT